jgi:regulator of nucleoside diphosphate kinase
VEDTVYAAPVLPPIIVHSHDYNQLVLAATLARRQGRPHATFLLAELRRASLCRIEEFPDGVVAIGSRITYRLNGVEAALTGTLVFAHEVDRCSGSLSVFSPVGTALLGLRVGDCMPFRWDGQESEVLVEHVAHATADGMQSAPRRQGASATNSKEALDRRLDHGLEETFPASDPVSVVCT